MSPNPNPWIQAPQDGHRQALARLYAAALAARHTAQRHTAAQTPLLHTAKSLECLAKTWEDHPDIYRQQRVFGAVDIPQFHALYAAMDTQEGHLDAALLPGLQAIAARTQDMAAQAQQATRPDPESLPSPPPVDADMAPSCARQWGKNALEWTNKGVRGIAQTSGRIGREGTALLGHGYDWTQASLSGLTNSLTSPARSMLKGLLAITSGPTILHALVNAGGMGILTCMIFPPALPIVVGLSLMDAAASVADAAYTESRTEDSRHHARMEERRQQAARRMAAILGFESSQPQVFGTEHVHMVLDPTTGIMDGRILTGQHTAQRLADLSPQTRKRLISHAPDAQTRAILEKWRG